MNRVVIGVDASSTRLAAVIFTNDKTTTTKIALSTDTIRACGEAYHWMRDMAQGLHHALIAVEEPFIHHLHPQGAIPMAQVNGALLAGTNGTQALQVGPSKWKKRIVGAGNASKVDIAAWVCENHPEAVGSLVDKKGKLDQDLVDAFCIAKYAFQVAELRDRMVTPKTA